MSHQYRWKVLCRLTSMGALLCMALQTADAQGEPSFRVGGLFFGDLYHVLSHHSEAGDGATGAVLRRGYLTFNTDFDENWFGRLRFEVNQSGEFETYDFDVQTKDIYLGRRFGRHKALLGLSSTPTFDVIESVWGLRYLARTPMDLQGVASRDTGLSLQGPLGSSGEFSYRFMYAAPVEFGGDSNDRERWMGAVGWQPAAGWTLDFYADYEALDGPRDRMTRQLFIGYEGEERRWGLQYSDQDRQEDPPLELASAFVVSRITDGINLFGRVDRLLEPSPRGDGISYLPMDPSARATMMFAGVEFQVRPHLVLTPNVVWTRYDRNDQGVRPDADLHLRLTLFIDFE